MSLTNRAGGPTRQAPQQLPETAAFHAKQRFSSKAALLVQSSYLEKCQDE